jgi:eukaryotic-like serine/threonine-protein kinase
VSALPAKPTAGSTPTTTASAAAAAESGERASARAHWESLFSDNGTRVGDPDTVVAARVAASPSPLATGSRIDRFVIQEQRGSGGMGVVYRARDPGLERDVAIKLLHPEMLGQERGRVLAMRLVREAQALAQLSHPNVVTVYEVGVHDESVFLAMEYIDGQTLDQLMAARRHGWREVVGLFVQAGRGLVAMHRCQIVHRDIKPSNLLVDRTGQVRLTDFGLARHVDSARSRDHLSRSGARSSPTAANLASLGALTAVGAVVGTPRYMAPEQYDGIASPRSDQFSFCVALWMALYGEHPFGDGTDRAALRDAVVAGRRRPPPRRSSVPRRIERLVARGLATEPAARHPSMAVLVEQLVDATRRSRVLAAGGALLAAGALVAALVGGRDAAHVDCSRAGDDGTAAWRAARPALLSAIAGSGRPGADATAARAAAIVDDWSDRWRATRIEACRATHDRGEQSEALLDRRMACLDRQLLFRGALVEALASADRAAVDKSITAASGLPAADECRADQLDPAAPPRSLHKAAALAATERILAEIDARSLLHSAGVERAERALALAEIVGEPGVRARAHYLLGVALWTGDLARSKRELQAAHGDAVVAADPKLQAAALVGLLRLAVGDLDERAVQALLPLARSASQAAGVPASTRVLLAQTEADAMQRMGRRAEASAACVEAVRLAAPHQKVEVESWCACALPVGGSRFVEAIPGCERAVAAAERVYGEESPEVAAWLSMLATGYLMAGRLPDARAALAHQLALIRRNEGEVSISYVRALVRRSEIEATGQTKSSQARATLVEALSILDRLPSPAAYERVNVLRSLSVREADLGECNAAIRHGDVALSTLEGTVEPDAPAMALMYGDHGQTLAACGQERRALTSLRRATAYYDAHNPSNPALGGVLIVTADLLTHMDQPGAAVAIAERAVILLADQGVMPHLAIARETLGTALSKLGPAQRSRARTVLLQALDDSKRLDNPAVVRRIERKLRRL